MAGHKPLLPFVTAVVVSLLLANLLAVFPLSRDFALLRPEFVCLLVIYWVMYAPQYVSMSYAWVIGLTQDVVEGYVWGAHALSLTVVAYICLVSYQRIRNYSIWHQAIWVFILVGVHQVLCSWVQGIAGYKLSFASLLLPTMISALFWPVLTAILLRLKKLYTIY